MKKIAILLLAFILAFTAEAQNISVPRTLRSGARQAEKGEQNDQKDARQKARRQENGFKENNDQKNNREKDHEKDNKTTENYRII